MVKRFFLIPLTLLLLGSCSGKKSSTRATEPITPVTVTDSVQYDTDDPAIWIHPTDPSKSRIIGTDKHKDGALYVYDLRGKIVRVVGELQRPNNVDVAYGLAYGDTTIDIAVTTERGRDMIRVFSVPDMIPIDGGGIPVFEGEEERAPMGIALYTAKGADGSTTIDAIVSRKYGPTEGYLHQYRLTTDADGIVRGNLVRTFGAFSGKKEIESIAVDNELGYVYYSDEQVAVRKYYADPAKGDEELAAISTDDYAADNEGISIYKHADGTGYILVSDQSASSFRVYPREGSAGDPHTHPLLAILPMSVVESDGSDVTSVDLGAPFEEGLFVAMSDDKTFQIYSWADLQAVIDAAMEEK